MPVINRNTPTEQISVPVPTPVQTQPKAPPQPKSLPHPPLSFGGENDEFGRRTQGVSAVILPWSPQPKRMSRKIVKINKPKRYSEQPINYFTTGKIVYPNGLEYSVHKILSALVKRNHPVSQVNIRRLIPSQFTGKNGNVEPVGSKEWIDRANRADSSYPILVVRHPTGHIWVADGNHRLWKAYKAGLKKINAHVIDEKDLHELGSSEEKPNEEVQPNQMSRRGRPKRYAGETTEEDFHRLLDANPDDHHTRLVFADWLQERNDPRAEGYRALGNNKKIAHRFAHGVTPPYQVDHVWYIHNPSESLEHSHFELPKDWYDLIEGHNQAWNGAFKSFNARPRQHAEDAAAHAFSRLSPERKHELLNPKQLSRKRIVVRYARPNLTPTQKERAKKVELVVLPKGIEGKKCGTCKYGKHHTKDKSSDTLYCTNNQVHMNVKTNWGCKLWDAKGVKRLQRKTIKVKKYQRPVPERGKLTPEEANLLRQHIHTGELVPLGMLGDSLAERGYPHTGALISRYASQVDPHGTHGELIGQYHAAYQQAPILREHDFHYVPGEWPNMHDVHIGVSLEEPRYPNNPPTHQYRVIGADHS